MQGIVIAGAIQECLPGKWMCHRTLVGLMVSDWYWLLVFWWRKLVWLLRGRPRISRLEGPVPDDRTIRLFIQLFQQGIRLS